MSRRQPSFRPYQQQQLMLLPPSLDDHMVRVVNDVINRINLEPLNAVGSAGYHPQMLLKVLVFGYMSNIYSSRKLEAACEESIYFIAAARRFLSSMSFPDHNTINRFRGVRLKDTFRTIFEQVVSLLAQEGYLSIEEVYTDGTKIEANANKYTFVWKKAIATNKEKMKKQLADIWAYAQSVAASEDNLPEPPDLTTINKEKVQDTVDTLNQILGRKENIEKKIKAKLGYVTKHYPANIARYEQQEVILGERNSYSKTDPDATFMRLTEDHMRNGQLKPAYNVQISTSNQFIVNYSIHANTTDTNTLASHLKQHEKSFGSAPRSLTADAGYGFEENYKLLEEKKVAAYVKYNLFDKRQSHAFNKKHPFAADKLYYDPKQDHYICPMGQKMAYIGDRTRKTTTGFEQTARLYKPETARAAR